MKLIVNGCAGRMGKTLVRLIQTLDDCELIGGLEASGNAAIGQDIGQLVGANTLGLAVADADNAAILAQAEGVIDFTTPEASLVLAEQAAQIGFVHVIGTTGFTAAQEKAIAGHARKTRIIKSGNMSLGLNLLVGLVKTAGAALGDDWDIDIIDAHHRDKVDAPSGSALMLGEAAAQARGLSFASHRTTHIKGAGDTQSATEARRKNQIGFSAIRGGTTIGNHEVIFAGEHERLVLGHIAENRDIFARGAIAAALWGHQQTRPGLYSMQDVLGLTT